MEGKNYAFIDGNNLYLGAKSQDINLDYGDAELVLHAAAIEYNNYNQAVIVTSDGDFACLMRYLKDNNKLKKIITPTEKFSKLLKPFIANILPLKTIRNQINKKDRNLRSVQEP